MDTKQELIDFLNSIKGKAYLTTVEIKRLYDLYNIVFGKNERPNYCSSCLINFVHTTRRMLGI